MPEMIDRISKAIDNVILVYLCHGQGDEGYHILDKTDPGPNDVIGRVLWRDHTQFSRYNDQGLDRPGYEVSKALRTYKARAALMAIRQPTKEMLSECCDAFGDPIGSGEGFWQRMIDFVLGEA